MEDILISNHIDVFIKIMVVDFRMFEIARLIRARSAPDRNGIKTLNAFVQGLIECDELIVLPELGPYISAAGPKPCMNEDWRLVFGVMKHLVDCPRPRRKLIFAFTASVVCSFSAA